MFLQRARSFFYRFICLVYWSCAAAAMAATPPIAPTQLAVYQGADREKILIDGAKREGQFTLYTSHFICGPLSLFERAWFRPRPGLL